MKWPTALAHEFVRTIPDKLERRTLYVSMHYAVAAHMCCCGCGREVVTPLSPTDWTLVFDGTSISLYPSIGNWSFECRSHYWITGSRVRWARQWSRERIDAARAHDRRLKKKYYLGEELASRRFGDAVRSRSIKGLWRRILDLWLR